jgi:methionyl-tRNA formyltransferase
LTNEQLSKLSKQISYITINPRGNFLKSAQLGFRDVGLYPEHLIYVKPTARLKKEVKKYKLSIFTDYLIPQIKRFIGNEKSFSGELVNIKIPQNHSVSSLNHQLTADLIKRLNIKYLVNCGAGIFNKTIINIPGLIILNAHAGKLPDYKNMNVVEWAICNNEQVFGTIHQIDQGIDTGAVWLSEPIDVKIKTSFVDAREYAFDQVIKMMGKAIIKYEQNKITPIKHSADAGKQWYRMHSYFKIQVEQILKNKI